MNISLPIVALESTVLTHGLPRPQNLQLAHDIERTVRDQGATPATIGFLDGYLHIGLSESELDRLANEKGIYKVGPRDFATVITQSPFDISADLQALATIPMIVVCAGAKAILDFPATLEYLETMSVPVIGFGTDKFPAFYSRESGLDVSIKLNTPQEIVEFAKAHWNAGLQSAVLVANPVPTTDAISSSEIEPIIEKASKEAKDKKIRGKELTPFLLQRISDLTKGKSMRANLSLLLNNARLAAQIAKALRAVEKRRVA